VHVVHRMRRTAADRGEHCHLPLLASKHDRR